MKYVLVAALLFALALKGVGQVNKTYYFRDSIDGALDVGGWLLDAHGFIPIVSIITEPALGNIGAAVAPIFITRRPDNTDTVRGKVIHTHNQPDVSGAVGVYTANESWIAGAFHTGTWVKRRIRYRVMAGYGDINLTFYRTVPGAGEQSFDFSFKTLPISGFAMKQIAHSNWYGGLQYQYRNVELQRTTIAFPDYVKPKEYKSNVSQPGLITEYDIRDNIFTPNIGFKFHTDFSFSDEVVGSDYTFQKVNSYVYVFHPFSRTIIGGLRIDYQQAFGEIPFYLIPYIDMRGIPAARYQGNIIGLTETEFRWDFYNRWSCVGFGGVAKAYDSWSTIKDANLVYSGGAGIRYLIVRRLGLRTGIDIAHGPEQWAYYIIFGSAWSR